MSTWLAEGTWLLEIFIAYSYMQFFDCELWKNSQFAITRIYTAFIAVHNITKFNGVIAEPYNTEFSTTTKQYAKCINIPLAIALHGDLIAILNEQI